jgi:membrane protease YdiL (CAAX protease family)
VFTIEGRAAPGLYFVGWIASIVGLGILLIGFLASGGMAPVVLSAVGAAILGLGLVAASGSQAIERREHGGAAYLGPSPFLVFAASLSLTILIVILVIGPAAALGLDTASPAATLLSVTITGLVYVGLVRFLVVGTGALDWGAMGVGRFGPAALGELTWGALFAVPVIVVTSVLSVVLVSLTGATPDSPLPTPGSAAGVVMNVIAATIVAPIGEELFYRGFATTAWARTMGSGRGAHPRRHLLALVHVLTIGGSTFGEAAGSPSWRSLPLAGLVALGWVFLRRRSIYASIGLHATFNGLLVILSQPAVAAVH